MTRKIKDVEIQHWMFKNLVFINKARKPVGRHRNSACSLIRVYTITRIKRMVVYSQHVNKAKDGGIKNSYTMKLSKTHEKERR